MCSARLPRYPHPTLPLLHPPPPARDLLEPVVCVYWCTYTCSTRQLLSLLRKGVAMTTGSLRAWRGEGEIRLCGARGLNRIMTVLHRDFIKAIHSSVFRYCGVCGLAKVPRDVPFKPEFPPEPWLVSKGQLSLKLLDFASSGDSGRSVFVTFHSNDMRCPSPVPL